VRAIEAMERNADRCHIIRYEELMANPREVLDALAGYLGVAPGGFDASIIRPTSVGKHREGLTAEELEQVMAVAGPTLERLGYL
jgi:hypothetical protein